MEKIPYEKLLRYPHLSPEESKIWDRFIEKNPKIFEEVIYDARVGEGRDYSDYPEDKIREGMEYLSKKRIDVVGLAKELIYVIEIRPKANLNAVGSALGLAELFRDVAPVYKIIIPAIITDEILPDMPELCRRMGVKLFLA